MRRLFGCPDIVSLTEKFLMATNIFWIFTENNPVMGYSKTFFIPEAKGLKHCTLLIIVQIMRFDVHYSKKLKEHFDIMIFI